MIAVFWISFCAWVALAAWIAGRERKLGGRISRREDRGSAAALALAALATLFFLFTLSPVSSINPFGIVLIWAGIILRFLSVKALGKNFKTVVTVQDEHPLIKTGIYRYLRHPSYTGSWMTLTGIAVALGNPIGIAIAAVLPLAAYLWRIRVEEAALTKQFGNEYENYIKKTYALVPFVW